MAKHATTTAPRVGRPRMTEDEKRMRVTVSLRPAGNEAWSSLARSARVSKGGLAEWLSQAPEALQCRQLAESLARYYVPVLAPAESPPLKSNPEEARRQARAQMARLTKKKS